ncbi:MAG: 50S ribosomal protein L20 [Chloroflexi bacterium]|nr:50S ribosomal protein L20 [Chloroflexota bacterium]
MPRVKRGVTSHHHHKKVLEQTKGQWGTRHRLFRRAKEALLHSLWYSYVHRRERKGDMRRLWIQRVNAAARESGLTYSQLIHGLQIAGVEVNRKVLADMAVRDAPAFAQLASVAKQALQ